MDTSKAAFSRLESYPSTPPSSSFDEEEEEGSRNALPFPQTQPSHRLVSAIPRLLVVILAIWGFLSLLVTLTQYTRKADIDVYRPTTFSKDYNHCDCGNTIAEARSKGCQYDSMAAAWLPKYCRDEELTARFEQAGTEPDGSWPYYADTNGTYRINIDEIATLGKGNFYATRYWHVAHCLFYWEKYVRMRHTGAVMEARFDSEKHTQHCRKLALKKNVNHDLLIEVEIVMNSAVEESSHEEHEHH